MTVDIRQFEFHLFIVLSLEDDGEFNSIVYMWSHLE